jgi:hypothetical protein
VSTARLGSLAGALAVGAQSASAPTAELRGASRRVAALLGVGLLGVVLRGVGLLGVGILCVGTSACGAAGPSVAHSGVSNAAVGSAGADTSRRDERAYTFEREQLRLRRSERNASTLSGTITIPVPDGPGSRAVTLERARYAQGDHVVREIDPAAGDRPLSLTQVLDASGAARLEAATRSLLGDELAQALELVPMGSCGVAHLDDGPQLILGFPDDSGLPRAYAGECTRAATARTGVVALHCEASLDRDLEVSSEARAQGVTASLRGRVTLDGELEVATGLCLTAVHHLSLDVISRLGAYEEHDAAELDLRTSLAPR